MHDICSRPIGMIRAILLNNFHVDTVLSIFGVDSGCIAEFVNQRDLALARQMTLFFTFRKWEIGSCVWMIWI